MRIAYFDCFSGASGDMILGALVSAGLEPEYLRAELKKLPLEGYEIEARQVNKQGFAAMKVDVRITARSGHRHLHHVKQIIDASSLSPVVKDMANRIFERLASAEAKVHGTTIEKIHFHEVGAVDAIVDVVGAAIGVERLGFERIACSPIPVGSGIVTCEHGVMPVPAPGTVELLAGVPIAACDEVGELTTPTGAAILTTLAESFGSMPAMRLERCGYGAGTRDGQRRPNVLRLFIGESAESGDSPDEVIVLEANIDDATGEQIGYAFEALFAAGAIDVFTVPITMKKNRPGVLLSVLAPLDRRQACEDVLFAETTTFGIRSHLCTRRKLARSIETVQTRFGPIRVKLGHRQGGVATAAPEYDDCAVAARESGAALREVMAEAVQQWRAAQGARPC